MTIQKKKTLYFILLMVFMFSCHSKRTFVRIPHEGSKIGCPFSGKDTLCCIPINPNDTMQIKEKAIKSNFKVVGIDEDQGVYRIKLEKDSLIHYRRFSNPNDSSLFEDIYYYPSYEIFTLKTKRIKGYKKIKKGLKYELTLNPYFVYDFLPKFRFPSSRIYTRGVYIKGKHIGISTKAKNIYTSPNVDGLYYISTPQ